MKQKNLHKVTDIGDPYKKPIPQIKMQGNWLSLLGFKPGEYYEVSPERNRITLEIKENDNDSTRTD